MPSEITLDKANCTGLSFEAEVQFSKDADGPDFILEAYTGQVVDRWWGRLAIDIDGIKAKKQIPILRDHNRGSIVGFSTGNKKDGSFFVEGKFSEATESAREVKALALEGFPWQASIGVLPRKILSLEKDGEHTVNGKKLKGPAEIWLESEVYETSFVPLGADSNTSVAMLTRFQEQPAPSEPPQNKEEQEMLTVEKLKEEHPDIYQSIMELGRKDGAAAELKRIKDVQAQLLPGHETLVQSMIDDGTTTGEQAAMRILQAEKQIRVSVRQSLEADGKEVPAVPVSQTQALEPHNQPQDLSTEEGLKAAWGKDPKLRSEFGNQFEIFKAYQENKHLAKVRG